MSKFEDLIEKYQKGLLDERQSKLLDAWFDNLSEIDNEVKWPESRKEHVKLQLLAKINNDNPKKRIYPMYSRKWVSMAASIAALIVSVFFVWNYTAAIKSKSVIEMHKISSANISKVILPDGSIVWLKAYSKLSYPEQFSDTNREVKLEGEALFEVAENPKKPFVITCGELKTTVLGTSFNIRANRKDIEVNVLTGKVALSSEYSDSNMILLPNEMGVFDKGDQKITKKGVLSRLFSPLKQEQDIRCNSKMFPWNW